MSTSTAPCFTAVDSWVSQDEMCLNVTFTAEPEMNNQNYHVRFTFPTWFIMGRQPYRAPHGTVRCSKAVISSTEQTIDCTSAGYPSFFAVFNMNSNQAAPSQYTQMSIVNNDKSTIPCVLKQWCPPIVTDATTSGGAGGDSSSQIPAGYINLPLIGPQPPWVVTILFSAIGIVLGGALFMYVRHRTRAQREALRSSQTIATTPTSSPKGTEGQILDPASMTLMQKAELMKQGKLKPQSGTV